MMHTTYNDSQSAVEELGPSLSSECILVLVLLVPRCGTGFLRETSEALEHHQDRRPARG